MDHAENKNQYGQFLAERLTHLRDKVKLSARDLSASMGQNHSYINNIENKKNLPSMSAFFSICEKLGVTPEEFFAANNQNPALLNELLEELKPLTDDALVSMLAFVRAMKDKDNWK